MSAVRMNRSMIVAVFGGGAPAAEQDKWLSDNSRVYIRVSAEVLKVLKSLKFIFLNLRP